jgi:dTDP-4-dehydrorhamnose 3,5-epimerase
LGSGLSLTALPIEGLALVHRTPQTDERGVFERLFDLEDLDPRLEMAKVVQVNRTRTFTRGTVRGLHYQLPPFAEYKLVTCLRGRVYDVGVDVRWGSTTFLRWHGEVLSADRFDAILVPPGVAHGLQALEDDCEMLYMHTAPYRPAYESGINPEDPTVGITWPMAVSRLSERDAALPSVSDQFTGVTL